MSIDKVINGPPLPIVRSLTRETGAGQGGGAPALPEAPRSLEAVAQRLEAYLTSVGRSLEFRVDAASGRTVLSVRDAQTGDLIRQIPGEEVLRLAEMAEDQTIVLVNERA
jgi:hypothetical protein